MVGGVCRPVVSARRDPPVKLALTINIGTHDAKELGLRQTLEGDVVTVNDEVGAKLLDRKWAAVVDDKPKPSVVPK